MIKKAANICRIFLLGLFLGTVLLEAVYLLPVAPMKAHVRESLDDFMAEGDNPFILEGYKGSSLDNSTDALMLGNAVFASEQPFYKAAMLVERAKDDEGETMTALQRYILEDDRHLTGDYSRYWHGYLVVLKPLLLFFNFGQIRRINGIVFAVALAVVLSGFLRRRMWRGCVAFLLAVAAIFPMALPYSLQYSSVFYIGMIAMTVILYKGKTLEKRKLWPCFFMVTGMCTSYMDFLTYPLFTLGMPLILCVILEKQDILTVIRNSIFWVGGYFGMWMGKWCVGSVLTGENLWIKALETANMRASGTVNEAKISRIMAVLRNFYIYKGLLGTALIVIVFIWVAAGFAVCRKRMTYRRILPYLLTACMPIVWYLLIANHSYIHYWYTFRILSVSIFALAMIPEELHLRQEERT